MKKCVALKFGRHNEIRLHKDEFAKLVDTDVHTIGQLESNEASWDESPRDLIVRIKNALPDKCWDNTDIDKFIKESVVVEEPIVIEEILSKSDGLSEQNQKSMTLIEFIFDGLNESKSHADFLANIGLLKRVLSKY